MPTNWFRSTTRFRPPEGAHRLVQYVDALQRFTPGHLVDLGAGHGIFARLAADLGWRVTAVDARDERFPDDDRVTWVVADIREFDQYDDVDVVSCLGLWYHLTLDDQLRLARQIAPRSLILDTHVAAQELDPYHGRRRRRISPVLEQQGYAGRVYSEEGLQAQATASWGNDMSFWPSVASLERQLYAAGFDVVEQVSPPHTPDRGFFVARTLRDVDELERLVARYLPLGDADAPPVAPLHTLAPPVAPVREAPAAKPKAPAAPPPPPSVRTSSRQLAGAVRRSARARLANLRKP